MPSSLRKYADPFKALIYRNEQRKNNYAQTSGYPPRSWTNEEDALILEHSVSDRELSEIINRSVQAIQVRRCRIKKQLEHAQERTYHDPAA